MLPTIPRSPRTRPGGRLAVMVAAVLVALAGALPLPPRADAADPAPVVKTEPAPVEKAEKKKRLPRIATAASTGVPDRQRLRPYRGPCTITRDGTAIVGRHVTCDLRIAAADVTVRNSLVHGTIASTGARSFFRVIRSTVDASPGGSRMVTVVGEERFRVVRSEILGGNRSINCWDRCTVKRSWVHGQDVDPTGVTHESGIRMGTRGRFVANKIACDAPDVPPDAGCSAPLTGYGDFGPVRDNLVLGNLFVATTGGTCAYGGSSGGKPYSASAQRIRFVDNRFQRGRTGRCGYWEPVMDFDRSAPGNQFIGNRWVGGGRVQP